MGILEELHEERLGRWGRDEFAEPFAQFEMEKTGRGRDFTLDKNEEFALTAKVQVLFWANQAQLPEARKVARRHLAALLYKNVHKHISELELAISNGDRMEAMKVVCELRKSISAD